MTVAEILASENSLGGMEVLVRGKVVKFNANVMGKNWVHLQDGTGKVGTNDLTITTDETAELGATVLVRGTVTLNKDFGHGYRYEVLIEDATITTE